MPTHCAVWRAGSVRHKLYVLNISFCEEEMCAGPESGVAASDSL